ncbi:glycosyltransferase [Modestobacter sp. VKM Ac-2983]|uniref:glycosyltransferase family 2 protein n=1 Tax=Modestobacter sp. VKM Ac-2983 TaxID=3004137 RepID=UPI0022AB5B53|nr:glycosyltransferase [Modestobacter sp. VKM Ac-2983]MCZ2803722.1 glycosyltransferase [Modestobacter sp. VKM Ac-2983]
MTRVSVVIPCFTEERWEEIVRAVESALDQTHPCEVRVVVDHNDLLLERLRRALGPRDVRVEANRYARGASGGRNTGAESAEGDLVVFLDDDEVAMPDWIENLVRAHRSAPGAVGLGGAVEARWPGGPPRWFPEEFSWAVGGTAPRSEDTDVRNVWGGNMAVRRDSFLAAGGFATDFGKVGHASQPEDTELCLRMNARAGAGARWRFVPGAVIWHEVPRDRRTFSFFLRRTWSEGAGKRVMATLSGADRGTLAEEHSFVRTVLTRGVAHHLLAVLRGDLGGLARAGATVLGVASAALGYLSVAATSALRAGPGNDPGRKGARRPLASAPQAEPSTGARPDAEQRRTGT